MKQLNRYWMVITFIIACIITVLSLWPLTTLPDVPGSDKIHHFIAYCSLMFPVAFVKRERLYWYYFVLLAFSGLIELLQPLVNRYCDWKDLLANAIGLLCGWAIARLSGAVLYRVKEA